MSEFEKELEELFQEDWVIEEIIAKEEQNEWEQQIYKQK